MIRNRYGEKGKHSSKHNKLGYVEIGTIVNLYYFEYQMYLTYTLICNFKLLCYIVTDQSVDRRQ